MKRYLKKVVFYTGDDIADVSEQGVLYIVDTKPYLDHIKSMGLPVLAWLHEKNRDQDLSAAFYGVEEPNALDMDFYEKVYRREMDIPWEIVETDRCLVREMVPQDAQAFEKMYEEPKICRYMKDFHKDVAGEEAYIREYQAHYRFYEYGVWSIVLKETGEVIGRAGFSEAPESPMPCLGYMMDTNWQRQGLAYEVCRALLKYAEEELEFEGIQLFIEEGNQASMGLAKKLGFVECSAAPVGADAAEGRGIIGLRVSFPDHLPKLESHPSYI